MTPDLYPTGVFCAALTPLKADLSPNHDAFVQHCRRLLDDGCAGVALLGTTGEANSFSTAERKALLEAAVAGGIAPSQLLPGTGVTALTETVELTRHAVSLGVSTVVMLPPFYYKGVSDEGLFASYCDVVERVGDDRLKGGALPHPTVFGRADLLRPDRAAAGSLSVRVRRHQGFGRRPVEHGGHGRALPWLRGARRTWGRGRD